jgi:hypothetical protein
MDLNAAKQVMLRTHVAALQRDTRASAIELVSGPGLGKSSSVGQMCRDLAHEIDEPVGLVTFMLATISSVDVRGFMLPVKSATGMDTVFSTPPWYPTRANMIVFLPDGSVIPRGQYDGALPRVGVLFLDEFGQAEDEVKKAAAELLLHGEVGTTALPCDWRVVAASNRMSDKSGVMRAMAFITNRRLEVNVAPSLPAWLLWANAEDPATRPHYQTLSFAQKNADLVFRDAIPAAPGPFCTPRTLCLMDKDLQALASEEDIAKGRMPIDSLAREVCAGWIGAGEAAQWMTHLKFADELPEWSAVEKNPDTAKLPPARDAQMVCGYGLAHNITAKNARPFLTYMKRLNIEMQVLTVRAITAQQDRAINVTSTREFGDWLLHNKELLIASRS